MDLAFVVELLFLASLTYALYLWILSNRAPQSALPRSKAEHDHCRQGPGGSQTHSTQDRRGVRLYQVHPPPGKETETTDIDIIAIHGLDTKSPDTWIWRDTGGDVNWLAHPEMLPREVGHARIFYCDWPADLFERPGSMQKEFEEFARLLLAGIKDYTREDRPILFIASCLGGVILLKALVMANNEYLHIRKATRGIVFLSTPFKGTALGDVFSWLKLYASIRGKKVMKMLDNIDGSTFSLAELVRSFTQLCQDSLDPKRVFTFYEKRRTNLFRKVIPRLPVSFPQSIQLVTETSGTLEIVPHPLPLDRDHVQMNKFCGPEDLDYKRVSGKIREILGKIREGSPLKRADDWILNKCYTDDKLKIERLSGEVLSIEQCYINLAVVEEPAKHTHRPETSSEGVTASSPFSLSSRLKIETPDAKFQVELPTLFDPRKASDGIMKQPRRILIRGRAGVGKTTLCKKIVHDFAHRHLWRDIFDRILWVPLRRLKKSSNGLYNLEKLFSQEYFDQPVEGHILAKELQRTIEANGYRKTLFILDGLDEISPDLYGDNQKADFLRHLLNLPNVIITSRPYASFRRGINPPDLELVTVGFYPDQVEEYIQNAVPERSKSIGIQKFLETHQLIQSLVRTPIQLDALCYKWDTITIETTQQTMTAMYKAIELSLWKKDVFRLKKEQEVSQESIEPADLVQLEDIVEGEMFLLKGLAFTGLYNDSIDFETAHQNAIYQHFKVQGRKIWPHETLPNLSFLRTSDSSWRDRNYHFLHLTFQEYFAARYFVQQWKAEKDLKCLTLKGKTDQPILDLAPVEFLRRYKYNARFNIFWRFVAGLLDLHSVDSFFQAIEEEPHDLLGPMHQRFVVLERNSFVR